MHVIAAQYTKFLWTQKLVNRTRKTYDRALRSLPITQHDKIWKQYTKFAKEAGVPEMACRIFMERTWIQRTLYPRHPLQYSTFLLAQGIELKPGT